MIVSAVINELSKLNVRSDKLIVNSHISDVMKMRPGDIINRVGYVEDG